MQIDKETLAMVVALAAVVGSIVSAIVGALSAFLTTRFTKQSEERKHLRELVMNTAYKEWEKHHDMIRSTPRGGYQYPLSDYVIIMAKYADLIADKNLTAENIEAKLAEINAMNAKMRAVRKLQSDEMGKRDI